MASQNPTDRPPQIFDRALYRRRRARAVASLSQAAYLHERAMADIVDRLETTMRDFPLAAFDGAAGFLHALTPGCGVGEIMNVDLAPERLRQKERTTDQSDTPSISEDIGAKAIAADPEQWPIKHKSLDLIVSLLTLHTTNDLIGALTQMRMSLKPDGLFLAAVFGADTLKTLRDALYAAEIETCGGVAPRISPFASVRDFGGAMQRAGFAMPVVDNDVVTVTFRDPTTLFKDLRAMGERNALARKRPALRRDVLAAALQTMAAPDGAAAPFEIVYLTGWAPAASQPKPLKPGAATASLADAVKNALPGEVNQDTDE
ncbi:MAG: methyltransferase domain-containing protein [Pseudomonadota bacterium]